VMLPLWCAPPCGSRETRKAAQWGGGLWWLGWHGCGGRQRGLRPEGEAAGQLLLLLLLSRGGAHPVEAAVQCSAGGP
jgi:hypothetical protein